MPKYLYERLKEPSTWRGVIMLVTAIGIPLAPAQAESIVSIGLASVGAIGAFVPDLIKK